MKCPDCGQELDQISIEGFDQSYRCSNCGGFWLEGWVINRIVEGKMGEFAMMKADIRQFTGKTDKCPMDQTKLGNQGGHNIPEGIKAKRCEHCGWWWFGGDNLLKLKAAYQARVEYFSLWKRGAEAAVAALPVIMTLVVAVGLVSSMWAISQRPKQSVRATLGVEELKAVYNGEGRETLRFKTDNKVQRLLIRAVDEENWFPQEVVETGDGWWMSELTGLTANKIYQVYIEGKIYYFITK